MGWKGRGTVIRSSGLDGHLERHLLGNLFSILHPGGIQQTARTNDLFDCGGGGKHRCIHLARTKNRRYRGDSGDHYRLCGLRSGSPMDRSGARSQNRPFAPPI